LQEAIKAKAAYVFLINQDTYVDPHCISSLIDAYLKNREYGIISPFHLSYNGDAIEEYFNNYIIGHHAPQYVSDLYFGKIKDVYPVSFVHAAGWLLPIQTIEKVGGFDPLFYHYGEDNDYVQRAIFKNIKTCFVPKALFFHNGTNSGLSDSRSFSLKRNFAVIQLKTPLASFAGALTMFVKGSFDGVTSAIVSRKRKKFMDEFKLLLSILKISRKISKSRKIQLKDFAYLK
jgi:GT2 family glycosyltransferase